MIPVLRPGQTQVAFSERLLEAGLSVFFSFYHWVHFMAHKCFMGLITHLCSPTRQEVKRLNPLKWVWVLVGSRSCCTHQVKELAVINQWLYLMTLAVPTFLKSKRQGCPLTPRPESLALPISSPLPRPQLHQWLQFLQQRKSLPTHPLSFFALARFPSRVYTW